MSEWRRFDSTEQLDVELAEEIARNLQSDIARSGTASLAVSGGSTPRGMFQQLSRCVLPWSNVDIMLVDERWVEPGSENSNERLLRECLLQHQAADANLVSLHTSHKHAGEALGELSVRLACVRRPFSAVVLGMGADGHTASWFSGASNLENILNPCGVAQLAASNPVTAPYERITLTFSAVLNSRNIFVHITGREKMRILEEAIGTDAPIAAILTQLKTPVTIWWAA